MTEDQLERLAELVFQKLLAKQEEWDQQYNNKIDRNHLVAEIVRLNVVKMDLVNDEQYEEAGKIQKEINKIREILNNNKLE
jgi:protein-arginine kinase activator protein McsA